MQIFILYDFSSAWETFFNIFYNSALLVMNSLGFFFFFFALNLKKAFIFILLLKDIVPG